MTNFEILQEALLKTVEILYGTLPTIFFTLLIADILIKLGLLNRLFKVLSPIIKRALLPEETSAAFMAAFGSQLSGNVVLKKLYDEKKITRGELLLSNQINSLPLYIKDTFTHFIPVAIPILGLIPGMVYTACFIFVGVFKLIVVFVAGRIILRKKNQRGGDEEQGEDDSREMGKEPFSWELVKGAFHNTMRHMKKMIKMLTLMTLLVSIAEGYGFFNSFQDSLMSLIEVLHLNIPDKMLIPTMTYIGNTAAANYMVGALYKSGAVGYDTASICIIIGSILAMPALFMRHTLGRNISIFGTKLGALNAGVNLSINMTARVIFLVALILFTL